jgi:hypothetical protein
MCGRQSPSQRFVTTFGATTILGRCAVPSLVGGIRRAQPKDSVGWRIPQKSLAALRACDIAIGRRVIRSGIDHSVLVTSPKAAVPHSRECRPKGAPLAKGSTEPFTVGRRALTLLVGQRSDAPWLTNSATRATTSGSRALLRWLNPSTTTSKLAPSARGDTSCFSVEARAGANRGSGRRAGTPLARRNPAPSHPTTPPACAKYRHFCIASRKSSAAAARAAYGEPP